MTTHPPTVTIAGASGFIGSHLVEAFTRDGWTVRTIGRGKTHDATWDDDLTAVLEGTTALVNLAGRSVSCRYTKRTADEIFRSRTETTKALGEALAGTANPPAVWLNSSTGTIYRDARDHRQDEADGELGTGFSVAVARAWEAELYASRTSVRKVALRMAIVLGSGGALNPLINLARIGFGGRQGDGGQMVSWLHVDDVYGAIRHLIDQESIDGAVNLAAPQALPNAELMSAVRRHLGRGFGIPLPAWSLDAGARIIRTESELVLKSRWVHPGRLIESGYAFRHPDVDSALRAIAQSTPRGLLPVQLG